MWTSKHRHKTISDAYKYHDSVKTLKYQQRFPYVEQSSSVPLIFAFTGGSTAGSSKTVQTLAEKSSENWNESYSDELYFVRTKRNFALLKSAIICLRGVQKAQKYI